MKCPVCCKHMIVIEHANVELDYCAGCTGVWLDIMELDLLLKDRHPEHAIDSFMKLPRKPAARAARKCPLCRRAMDRIIFGDSPEVQIDGCPRRHGFWFESGELKEVIRHLPHKPSIEGKVAAFLRQFLRNRAA